jgi:rare lipoprotein A
MRPPASSPKRKRKSRAQSSRGRAVTVLVLAVILFSGMSWADDTDRSVLSIKAVDSDVVVLALADTEQPATTADTETSSVDEVGAEPVSAETCPIENTAGLSLAELRLASRDLLPFAITPQTARRMLKMMPGALAGMSSDGVNLVAYMRRKIAPQFAAMYRAVVKRVAVMGLPSILNESAITRPTVAGAVSTYNPYRDGTEEGGMQTASGEPYDPFAWTAAVKTDLRNQFGGVRYGRLYQLAFALVESGLMKIIVKINDVGPLKPGRVLDLNERSMRHFDPFLTRGFIENVKVTLLPGEDWTPGPIDNAYAVAFATSEGRVEPVHFGAVDSSSWQTDFDLAPLRTPLTRGSHPLGTEDVRAEIKLSEGG